MPTGTANELDQQKAALVAAIAQQGSQGQQAFIAEQARRQAAQQAAVAQIAQGGQMTGNAGPAPAAYIKQLQGQQADLGSVYAQDAAMSKATFDNSIAQSKAAGESYFNAAKAALPVVEAQTAGSVARIREEMAAEREARAYEAQMRAKESEMFDKEAEIRRLELEQRRRELEAAKDEPTEEELKAQEDKARGFLTKISNQGTAPSEIAKQVVNDAPDFKTAVSVLDSYGAAFQRENPDYASEWNPQTRASVIRSLYNIYNVDSGKTAPPNAQEFGKVLAAQGFDPEKLLPGYVGAQDRQMYSAYAAGRARAALPQTQVQNAARTVFSVASKNKGRKGKSPVQRFIEGIGSTRNPLFNG